MAAENYYQHAEHYFRIIAAAQEQFRQNQPQQLPRPDNEMSTDEGDDDGDSYSNFGQEPGFVPQQQQPYMRDNNAPREGQPYVREQQQPREHRDREHRPQPQYQPQPPNQPQPVLADAGGVDRLPSFITGPQPQVNGTPNSYEGSNERGHDNMAAPAAPSEDFNPGNE